MSNIWLHRKLTLINVINDITETDYDDINLSIVLNVLWTAEGEEQTYLLNTLRNMVSGEFDEKSYSKSFLEQLDLICTIPVSIPATESESSDSEEIDRYEGDIEDETIEDESVEDDVLDEGEIVEQDKTGIKNIGFVFGISSILMVIAFFMQRASFSIQSVIAALPHWAYFWLELFLVVIVLIAVACMIKTIASKIAEQIATLGYLILFLPLLWILKGFTFNTTISLIATGILLFAVILSFSRICSYNTLK